jgi:hypothetical protein
MLNGYFKAHLETYLETWSPRNISVLFCSCIAVALVSTGAYFFSAQRAHIFANSAVAIQAEVIEMAKELRQTGTNHVVAYQYIPIFQYKVAGTVFERRLVDQKETYAVGDTTTIFYNPENPSEIRDMLKSDSSQLTKWLACMAMVFWSLTAVLMLLSVRTLRRPFKESRREVAGSLATSNGLLAELASAVDAKCAFVSLEPTSERARNSRMIRLVCTWTHPVTGREHVLRSSSFHPSKLPTGLEKGTLIACRVDLHRPELHEVLLNSEGSTLVA